MASNHSEANRGASTGSSATAPCCGSPVAQRRGATHHQSERVALSRNVIAAQSADIEEMQSWLRDWYGISYELRMTPGDQQMLDRLSSLSGAEFEITFMEMLIKHHEKAIKEAQQCLAKAWHAELRQLCQNIIDAQSAEITQLRSWLCEWYGRCK